MNEFEGGMIVEKDFKVGFFVLNADTGPTFGVIHNRLETGMEFLLVLLLLVDFLDTLIFD
jgi:hypothetical protein